MKTITIKLPAALDRRLRRIADRQHRSRSAVLRDAAERYLEDVGGRSASCLETVGDLLGSVEGPADLSSNTAHLRGFGG